jgi:ribA/ribD-fused uncharacterized protein
MGVENMEPADHRVTHDPDEEISWFEDSPLTNFYRGAPIGVDDVPWPGTYATAEHAFQAQKATSGQWAEWVAVSDGPDQAKVRGRSVTLRQDWEEIKEDMMRAVLQAKFKPGRPEYEYLMSTGDKRLIEGTTWHDTYWGVDLKDPGRPGLNRLGHLLMELREELGRNQ